MYQVKKCACGHANCSDWHVYPVAMVQGVSFTHEQAIAVSLLLNGMEEAEERDLALKEPPIIRETFCESCERVLLEEEMCVICSRCKTACCEFQGGHF